MTKTEKYVDPLYSWLIFWLFFQGITEHWIYLSKMWKYFIPERKYFDHCVNTFIIISRNTNLTSNYRISSSDLLSAKNFDGSIRMPNFYISILKMDFNLVVLESIDLQ